ncbi:hypothetical protein [uncultured Methanobrevibacter sp.]|uniref:hypothetical protein n=1 Tax=uncultured Methanobrevibacter sp. TaxID=253161 RepID=UPI0025D2C8FB|nr:hypothetical protein [uncultured Methanobrevibacter sp.]
MNRSTKNIKTLWIASLKRTENTTPKPPKLKTSENINIKTIGTANLRISKKIDLS